MAGGREEGSSGTNERGGRGLWGWVQIDDILHKMLASDFIAELWDPSL